MADIVNLRQFKKQKARKDKAEQAEKNRAASSIPGKLKKSARNNHEREIAKLDGKKLEKGSSKENEQSDG